MENLSEKVLGINDTKFRIGGTIICALLIPFVLFPTFCLGSFSGYIGGVISCAIYTIILWTINRIIVLNILNKHPLPKQFVRSIGLQLIAIIVATVCISTTLSYLEGQFVREQIPEFKLTKVIAFSAIIALAVSAVYNAIFLFFKLKASLVETEKSKRAQAETQLQSLKTQVNPHFLFNSLNTLSSLVVEDPEVSQEYIKRLSKVYRYLLEIKNKPVISIREEIDCVNAYLYMLKIRYEEGLYITMNIENCLQGYILPLAIQMLLENVVKHNIISKSQPLSISIECTNEEKLVVTNNIQLKRQAEPSTKVGLNNLEERYQIIFGKSIKVDSSDTVFKVEIPILKIEDYESSDTGR